MPVNTTCELVMPGGKRTRWGAANTALRLEAGRPALPCSAKAPRTERFRGGIVLRMREPDDLETEEEHHESIIEQVFLTVPLARTKITSANVKPREMLLGYFVGPFCAFISNAIFGSYLNRYYSDVLGWTDTARFGVFSAMLPHHLGHLRDSGQSGGGTPHRQHPHAPGQGAAPICCCPRPWWPWPSPSSSSRRRRQPHDADGVDCGVPTTSTTR